MSPLAHPKGKTPSRSSNLRKGVLFSAYGRALLRTTSQSASQPAPLVGEPLAKPFTLRGLPKPLPLGEVSPKVTERASPAGKSRCAAMGRLFVRAMLSLCQSCLSAA